MLLQMIYVLLCLDDRSRILLTQNCSLNTVQLVLPQHTTCLRSTLLAALSRGMQDWGNNSRLSGWVSSPSIVVSGEIGEFYSRILVESLNGPQLYWDGNSDWNQEDFSWNCFQPCGQVLSYLCIYKCHHWGYLSDPFIWCLGLHTACPAHVMCHHKLWPTSVSHPK